MAYKKNNPNKKTTNHTKIIPTKPKSNKGFKGNQAIPSETKIVLENRTIETKTWKQATKNFMITYLLPFFFILFFSWLMFYKIIPRIGEDLNNFIAGAKDNFNKFCQENYDKFKNNIHDIKDNFYNRFKEWNWPDWLANTGSIIVPLFIGGVIALCCLAIPIVGPPLAAITGICTIVVGSFMFFTDKTTPQNPPTPPREDVTVIEYDENQQKEKGVPTKNITKK
ncbi:hypothetical protein C6B37_02525 [Candidatus Phytoplasma phoenicium]|uniref:Uncharacterized protein n=2 Tax=Mollicutes TaxID=31969 RepID=A0A2S8NT90_9MOLU|nr:hypothetical protein C6B38_04460 [Spiroplasma sp. ChiS]PQP79155.1 hypothetical protein C6B37_02525 [Candidatus Phytoplasma phoenicium]